MKTLSKYRRYILFNFAIIYFVGLIFLHTDRFKSFFIQLTPLTLILAITISFIYHKPSPRKYIFKWFIIAVAGFLIEVIGVHTGMIFGNYMYISYLGPKIGEVPLLIGFNWVLLLYGAYNLGRLIFTNNFFLSLFISVNMVCMDILIEPFAIYFNLWQWLPTSEVPLQNYFAWFFIGWGMSIGYLHMDKVKSDVNKIAVFVYFVLVGFFFFNYMLIHVF